MNAKSLANTLTKKNQGKKREIVGNVREDVGHISDIIFKESEPVLEGQKIVGVRSHTAVELYKNGQRRAARNKKSK